MEAHFGLGAFMDKNQSKREVWAVDLDATTAQYEEGDLDKFGHDHIGAPVPEMVAQIKEALKRGIEVFIFTARVTPSDDSFQQWLDATRSYGLILAWCEKYIGVPLPVTNQKLRCFTTFKDDRAEQIVPNTGVSVADLLGE